MANRPLLTNRAYRPLVAKRRPLLLILIVALALRLIFALALDPNAPYADRKNDAGWYLGNGYTLITGQNPADMLNEVSNLASPPLYFIVIGLPQAILSPAAAVMVVRVLQAVLSTATVYFAYKLGVLLTKREGAGLIAAGVLAISPVFIVESAQILTETLYIFLIVGGVWLYSEYLSVGAGLRPALTLTPNAPLQNPRPIAWLLLAAILFGLAALTRAVLLGFPFLLVIHLFLLRGRGWRKAWKPAALFLLVFALTVSTWTVYSVARWNRFVIAGEGLPSFFYLGVTGWTSAQQIDQSLQATGGSYVEGAQAAISSDPLGWAKHRVSELANAYLQPHGTTFYPGASLKDQALKWLDTDRSLNGLIALTQANAFWSKLALYALHYAALIGGLAGIWLYRRQWPIALPLIGFIIYVTLVHLVLLALPRYIFPTEVFWWIFAAAALDRLFARLTRPRLKTTAV
ncbi:MAG: phospholipid carrier-dependent glycosyltransferase [Chloroflexota bacterium]